MKPVPKYVPDWRLIIAIIPRYTENQKTVTDVYYQDGSHETYECRCETVINDLARAFRGNIPIQRSRAQLLLTDASGGKNRGERRVPLVFLLWFCLVPIKFREKLKHNDSTIGYVVLQYVDRVVKLPDGRSRILFHISPWTAVALQRRETVEAQLERAWQMQNQYGTEIDFWQTGNSDAKKRFTDQADALE